jgi:deoxyhypusine synthase
MEKKALLKQTVTQLDLSKQRVSSLVDAFGGMAFQARNLSRAAKIYEKMAKDPDCAIILCLAGSLFSAGLKRVICDLMDRNLVDAIVSTGAILVDQDFFEGLGFKHYQGSTKVDDNHLRDLAIDRIYDTYIDEDELRICDFTIEKIADSLPPRPHSSRAFLSAMGTYLKEHGKNKESVVLKAYEKHIPLFVPAFSDCSAGFGLVLHQSKKQPHCLTLDSAKDFLELTELKIKTKESGLVMIGGGVPKNFAQDTVVAAELLGHEAMMHKYAIQITVADERDGALSGSTLEEASSWGKVATTDEQMVFCEATIALPLIAGYVMERVEGRAPRALATLL